jgi:nucleotide-binding universal stress UspA family protein
MNAHPEVPRILVPLDESPLAERALELALDIAKRGDAALVLLSVPRVYGTDLSWYYTDYVGRGAAATDFVPLEELIEESRDEARSYLDRIAARVTGEGVACETRVAEEIPAQAIHKVADELEVSLVVMSTHGRTGLTRWALGSVADKVLRSLSRPILLVRAGAETEALRIEHIMVGLDGSSMAEQVLPCVAWLAGALSARVTLASVAIVPDILPETRRGVRELTGIEKDFESQLSTYLEGHVSALQQAGVEARAEVISSEDVAHALIDRDARGDVDLVALTTHGRGGLTRWAFGSVADRVVRGAQTPVLVLRAVPAGPQAD